MSAFRLFSIGRIPVSVSPMYFILLLWWLQGGIREGLIWAACVTISILVHELGHATVALYFRLEPEVLLHGLGGLCAHRPAVRDRDDALIVAAGPAAGLVLGTATYLLSVSAFGPLIDKNPTLAMVFDMMFFINIIWSFVNLLPILPLDGGQLFRLLLVRFLAPRRAEVITHWVSLAFLAGALVLALKFQSIFLAFLAIYAVWENVQGLSGRTSSGPVRTFSKHAGEMLDRAREAYQAENFREAARLCHLIREEPMVAPKVLKEMWTILGASSARLGEHEQALHYLQHAPDVRDAVEAKIECYHVLQMDEQLDALLESQAFLTIEAPRRAEILSIVRPS